METRGGKANETVVQNLSGGQRTMLAMVADLARRMVQVNPHLGLFTPAVVLIDEVDLHLHPRWQETVLETLLKIFPFAQFIVTTHSEQIVSAVPSECVVRLENSSGGIRASSIGDVRGATWDETLQDAMGLEADRPAEPARLLAQLWELARSDQGDGDEAQEIAQRIRSEYPGAASELARIQFEVRRRAGLAKMRQGRA
jgi:predicted ATP-binding protein involved in virulence